MNESEFIELYTEITECAETQARSVYMVMSESPRLHHRASTGPSDARPAGDGANQPVLGPPESKRMP